MTIYQILMTKYQRLLTYEYQISTKDYVRIYKSFMQNKPNFRNDKMNITIDMTSKYEILPAGSGQKTNPIQTQFNPIQSQNKPNQTQFLLSMATEKQTRKPRTLTYTPFAYGHQESIMLNSRNNYV